jgi:hypothetical protein
MKKSNNIIIIGCSISSLYAAIRCIDIGYKVQIIERKNSVIPVYDSSYRNFSLYNDNHKVYISLLKRFNIKTEKFPTEFNQNFINIIRIIIQKSKLIPQQILMTYTFKGLYNTLLSHDDINELNSYDNYFGNLFEIINAIDCINMFTNDIIFQNVNIRSTPLSPNNPYIFPLYTLQNLQNLQSLELLQYYYVSIQSINELINNMISYIHNKNGKIIYNHDIKTIKYIKRKFIIGASNHNMFNSDMLMTTISKNNLCSFNFWNNTQLSLMNTVHAINSCNIKNILEQLISFKQQDDNSENIRDILLDDLHIVYPICTIKDNNNYVWNPGVNSVIVREKIRTMYNNKFMICSESFSKNNMFINYSLEMVDNALNI